MNLFLGKDYQNLRLEVQNTFAQGLKRIEQEKVNTYWRTGELISNYILTLKGIHGEGVVDRLAEDLNVERSVLNRTIQFYRKFPHLGKKANIARGQYLNWTQYRALLPIQDDKKRFELARQAEKEGWTQPQLIERVRGLVKEVDSRFRGNDRGVRDDGGSVKLKCKAPGPTFHYRIISEKKYGSGKSEYFIDLGFGAHIGVERFNLGKVQTGMVFCSTGDSDGTYKLKRTKKVKPTEVFTYKASVLRVIDGDTLVLHIDLGFGILKKVKIRLAGIDTPPLTEVKGRKAKAFVESIVRKNPELIIRSEKSGKYGRYLADIFLTPFDVPTSHLNQMLLDNGLAQQLV